MKDQKEHWAQTAKLGALQSVIDPNDTRGLKNFYIAQLRDGVLLGALPDGDVSLLDFGCGSGNLSRSLATIDRRITGIDISPELLEIAVEQNDPTVCKFVLYDGGDIPLDDQSFDYVATYVVLNHIVDDEQLITTLQGVRKTLKNDGKALFIEQTRRTTTLTYGGIKNQRSVDSFVSIFERAGFAVEKIEHVRRARFLPVYLIRYGLVPRLMFPFIARLDKFFATLFSAPRFSYVDTLFVLKKKNLVS